MKNSQLKRLLALSLSAIALLLALAIAVQLKWVILGFIVTFAIICLVILWGAIA